MRPTLSPSARVSELPPVEVRLAALSNSPGKGGGGAGAAGTGGSVLRSVGYPAARGLIPRKGSSWLAASEGWAGRDATVADLGSADRKSTRLNSSHAHISY